MNKALRKSRALAFVALVGAAYFVTAHADARDPKQAALFKRTHVCPSTHSTKGACTGYVINHKKPLCLGGRDAPDNMEWQEYKASLVSDANERRQCAALRRAKAARNSNQ